MKPCHPIVVVIALLLVGCSPTTTSQRITLTQGQGIENYRLARITPDGKAEFQHNHTGDFTVGVGGSFAEERQSRHRTVYDFTVEHADSAKQEATVLVRTTEY